MDCSLPGSSVHGIFPGNSTGVDCHFLLQGIFLTQGSNPGLPHCRQMLYHLSHQGSPVWCNSHLWFSVGKVFKLWFLSRFFSLSLIFCNFNIMSLCVGFLLILSCLVFYELPGPVVSITNFGKFPVIVASNISSVFILFIFLLIFSLHVCYTFCSCP